ncbi:4-hydroxy-tetrahydrodipicolinate reductase [Quillaja saponaria]|uniref:4-hydroxy-tetrahydrodipicolinate reductase n=1 Tax=Quillaja saponaria TaxID=32244 RepID=A0AAD7PDU1_QUISA|nr:4-hydroxy-tetrahydrodipicolinate reductase [Quillaja saponaria]
MQTMETKLEEKEEKGLAIWDCGSPLYDSYELVSLSRVTDRHLMALPSLSGSEPLITQNFNPTNDVVSLMVQEMGLRGNSKGSS